MSTPSGVTDVSRRERTGRGAENHPNAVRRHALRRGSLHGGGHQMVQSAAIGRIVRHPTRDAESRESTALLVGATAFVLGAAVGLVAFWGRNVPLSGRGSLGDFVAIGGAVAAIAAFVAGFALRRAQEDSGRA